ncbi:MAG TPA: dTMP kinase [Gemmatimonadaceae bacterium]|nr:dTMP kinase [Gemmatimonadaceae bacterium]
MKRGRLIVFEGPEGVGKTTQLGLLGAWLEERSIAHIRVREPGGTALGNEIRSLLLDPAHEMDARAEALLFMASRAALVDRVVAPAMQRGALVLADRFFLSTYAYQVAGRGLPENEIRGTNRFATRGLVPDLTLLFSAPAGERGQRRQLRGSSDRIESEGTEFHTRVAEAFEGFLLPEWQRDHPECGPIAAVDACGAPQEVLRRVIGVLESRLPDTFAALDASRP